MNPPLQHTHDDEDCPACEEMRANRSGKLTKDMTFREASKLWLEARMKMPDGPKTARYILPRTGESYEEYRRSLCLFFGSLRLEKIHIGHIRCYQDLRAGGEAPFVRLRRPHEKIPRPLAVTAKKVNQELSMLRQILKRAYCWTAELKELYEPLMEERGGIPRALTPAEQQHWLSVAGRDPEWEVVYWYSLLAFATTMGTNEMRALRICDIDLGTRFVYVCKDGAKNRFRERSIPLVEDAPFEAAKALLARAAAMGATAPDHYVFPFRKRRKTNAELHMTVSGIKAPWNEVRRASGLLQFYPYATRHTAITRMAESGIDFPMIQSFAGHISERMTRHYIQICDQAKRRALKDAAERRAIEKLMAQRKPPQSEGLVAVGNMNDYAINAYGT